MKRKVLISVGSIILILFILNFRLIYYGFIQAGGQIKVLLMARPVRDFLNDPEFPDSLKARIQLVDEIKKYAVEELGLSESDSYQKIYDQKGKDILWVVTACEPYALKAREWSFPLIGTFAYKGFFNEDMAYREKDKLEDQGFDTGIRTAGAWSTLGYFSDPIMSKMLLRDEGELTEVIIHELTHGTVFIKDSLTFNENIASFIGEQGAIEFLKSRYGPASELTKRYLDKISDRKVFYGYMDEAALMLDTFYSELSDDMPNETKQKLKENMIQQIIRNYDTLSFTMQSDYYGYFDEYLPNNTFFMSFLRYHGNEDILDSIFHNLFNGDIRMFIKDLKTKYGK